MNLLANSTGVVAIRLIDLHEDQPTALQIPVIAWRTDLESDPVPVLAWGFCYDAIHDPRTGHVFSEIGETWLSLEDAVRDLAKVLKESRNDG